MIVIGTALAVQPVSSLVDTVRKDVPKVLINMTNTKESGYEFNDGEKYPLRLWLNGKCDEIVADLVEKCGWNEDFDKRIKKDSDILKAMENLKLDEETKADS